MTEKEIEINKAFIQKGIDMSLINATNPETGFISGQVCNQLDNQKLIEIATSLRSITQTIAKLFEERNTIPNQIQSGLIFQYFFDRAVEIFYKQFNGIETDSVSFNVQDAFDYYEPRPSIQYSTNPDQSSQQHCCLNIETLEFHGKYWSI